MSQGQYDAIVIGGGPGGSTVATLLARAGKRVLVLEKEHFPRFHIGESLLPYNRQIFRQLGVLEKLEAAGFPRKFGAQFHIGNGTKSLKLVFKNGCFTRETEAFQVERSVFDNILLKHSSESGAEVREGWTVTTFAYKPGGVEVQARDEQGRTEVFTAPWLLDASGRANCTGNQENLRVVHPRLKKVAVFGHFEGVLLDNGPAAGDTVIVRLKDKWFWIIPLADKVSVGCVLDQTELSARKQSPADVFLAICNGSTEMRQRMQGARLVRPIQTMSDFSYINRRLVGPGLLRVGDAAGFMDPIFLAGVYLAMHSGKLASEAVRNALDNGGEMDSVLRAYEKRVYWSMRNFTVMVEKFYTQAFMELFMEPRPKFNLPDAIVAILAGELDGGWTLELRRKIFYFFIRAQQAFPLVPRITFDEPMPATASDLTFTGKQPARRAAE